MRIFLETVLRNLAKLLRKWALFEDFFMRYMTVTFVQIVLKGLFVQARVRRIGRRPF